MVGWIVEGEGGYCRLAMTGVKGGAEKGSVRVWKNMGWCVRGGWGLGIWVGQSVIGWLWWRLDVRCKAGGNGWGWGAQGGGEVWVEEPNNEWRCRKGGQGERLQLLPFHAWQKQVYGRQCVLTLQKRKRDVDRT